MILLQKDFNDEDAPDALIDALGGHKADIVMSDMAAPTTGHRATDHMRIIALVELAADFAIRVLAPGGTFVAKVFQGGTEHELLGMLKHHFATTIHAKPKASRADSAETYLLARGFKGADPICKMARAGILAPTLRRLRAIMPGQKCFFSRLSSDR